MRLPQSAGFRSLCAGAGRARSKAHPSSNGFGCAAIFNALTVPPQAGFRICAKSLLGIDPANCRVASSDRLALAHGSLALRVSANLSDHSLSTAVLALLTRSCPSRRLRRTAEMGGFATVRFRARARRYQTVGSVTTDPSGVGCPPCECPWYSRDWERTGTGYRTKDEKDARNWTIHSWRS